MARWLPLLIAAGGLALCSGASAHPHVWVTVKTTVQFKDNTIVGLQQNWTFDEFYAAMAIEGLDKNNDGIYDRQELAPLAQVNIDGIKEFDYFTFAKLGTDKLAFAPPTDYWLEYSNKILALHFILTLAKPVPVATKGFAFSTYDASFFIDSNSRRKIRFHCKATCPRVVRLRSSRATTTPKASQRHFASSSAMQSTAAQWGSQFALNAQRSEAEADCATSPIAQQNHARRALAPPSRTSAIIRSATASSSGSSTTLSCSFGSVRAMTAETGLSLKLKGRCGTPAGI